MSKRMSGLKYVYGPVPSRRLGSSLGVNLTPFKTCSYSCVYCQLGPTTCKTVERKSFFPKNEVVEEIERVLDRVEGAEVDYLTFAGEGEPTLNSDLGWIAEKARSAIESTSSNAKVAVITNSSLLWRRDVREDLMSVDACLPSLDAASESIFRRVNRPHRSLALDRILEGLAEFGDEYEGEVMLEVMLVKGYNDSEEELEKIASAVSELRVDKLHILTPVRPPASNVEPADAKAIMLAVEVFEGAGVKTSVIDFPECGEFDFRAFSSVEEAVKIMSRHPMQEEQLEKLSLHFGVDLEKIRAIPGVVEKEFRGKKYYIYIPDSKF